jgi:ELWxxDGT repeat protein
MSYLKLLKNKINIFEIQNTKNMLRLTMFLCFVLETSISVGQEFLVKDINTIPAPINNSQGLTKAGNLVYFRNRDQSGNELWKSDGTPQGTSRVIDLNPGPAEGLGGLPARVFEFNDKFFFAGNNGITGIELWMTDGTVGGTKQVKDIVPGSGHSFPSRSGCTLRVCRG